MQSRSGDSGWLLRALGMCVWALTPWCSTTSAHCIFETDQSDRFRKPGYSKKQRLEPQITIGVLTDTRRFPLLVEAFEGNKAETHTLTPSIISFMATYHLPEVNAVANAGTTSDSNLKALAGAGMKYIIGQKIPEIPYVIKQWRHAPQTRSRESTGADPTMVP